MNKTANQIKNKLSQAGVMATIITNRDGSIAIEAECDWMARDVLGMDRFRDYFNGVEVVII